MGAQYCAWPFGPMTRSKPPMPKLSSADTPPEKSSACLPVSTIALVGVITRMPLVCMSIVASAFQYGWRADVDAGDDDVHLAAAPG